MSFEEHETCKVITLPVRGFCARCGEPAVLDAKERCRECASYEDEPLVALDVPCALCGRPPGEDGAIICALERPSLVDLKEHPASRRVLSRGTPLCSLCGLAALSIEVMLEQLHGA